MTKELNYSRKAILMWARFNDSEKRGVKFGLFPSGPMEAAAKEGYDGKQLVNSLMKISALQKE